MGSTNQVEADLLAAEDRIEAAVGSLKTAVVSEVKNATDEIKILLAKTVVSPAVEKAITDRLNLLSGNVEALTPTVTAADPGPQATEPPPPPPPPPPAPEPTPEPTPAPPEGGSTVDNPPTV